nr:MFS transporter [Kineosporia rhizophila]
MGIVVIAEAVPHILIGLFGRKLVARVASFRALAGIEAAQIPVIAAIPWLWDSLGLAGIIVVIVIIGTADSLSDPARASLVPELVPAEQLRAVTGLMDVTGRLTWILGPGAAAALLAVVSTDALFLIDAATFAVSALVLLWLARRAPETVVKPDTPEASTEGRAAEAAPTARTVARRYPVLAWAVAVDSLGQAFYGVISVGVPVLLTVQLGLGVQAFGVVLMASGLGAVLGNLAVGNTPAPAPGRWLTVLCAAWIARGIVLVGFAFAGSLAELLILSAVASALMPLGDVTLGTQLGQLPGPDRLRAMTVYTAGLDIGCMVSMAALPLLVSASVGAAFTTAGLVVAAAAGALLVLTASTQKQHGVPGGLADVPHPLQNETGLDEQPRPGREGVGVVDHR